MSDNIPATTTAEQDRDRLLSTKEACKGGNGRRPMSLPTLYKALRSGVRGYKIGNLTAVHEGDLYNWQRSRPLELPPLTAKQQERPEPDRKVVKPAQPAKLRHAKGAKAKPARRAQPERRAAP